MNNMLRIGEEIEVRRIKSDGSFSLWLKATVVQLHGERAFFAENEKKINVYRLMSNENETWRRVPAETLSVGETIQYLSIAHGQARWSNARVTEVMGDYGFLVEPKGHDRIVRLWVNEEGKKWRRLLPSETLKLCPGCNSTASLSPFGGDSPPDDDPHEVTCDNCQFYAFGTTKESAIETWNTRYAESESKSESEPPVTSSLSDAPRLSADGSPFRSRMDRRRRLRILLTKFSSIPDPYKGKYDE